MKTKWIEAQQWEMDWWGSCINSLFEEEKQLVYAEKMGLHRVPDSRTPYRYDCHGKIILDIGGGPVSILLKCFNFKHAKVVDPIIFPEWIRQRYQQAGIFLENKKGEDIVGWLFYDEVWLYNVLEHTENPQKVIVNAQAAGSIIRLFEWIDTVPSPGHPHSFKEEQLNDWLRGEGKVETFKRGGATGKGYYGIFKGNGYESPAN